MPSSPTQIESRQPSPSLGAALTQPTFRLRLASDDGTPTAWWAFLGIVAPSLVVLSIIAVAIIRY